MPEPWLDRMFEPCGVYRAVREDGVIVDFERVFLNAAGRRALQAMNGDESVTRMRAAAPNVVEQGLFAHYVHVAETGEPWTGVCQTYEDELRSVVLDIQAWQVPDGIAITYRDVTERERLGEQLRESEERYRATFDLFPEAVSVLRSVRDEHGRIVDFGFVYTNAANAELTGYSVEHMMGTTLLALFPEQGPTGIIDRYAAVVETGETWHQPTLWYEDEWGDGTRRRRAFDLSASKVGDGFVIVSRDVTDLREAADAMDELSDRLASANAQLGQRAQTLHDLIGMMGHDVINPAAAGRGFIELARTAIAAGRQQEALALLDRAVGAGHRVEQLLANVLAMAQGDLDSLQVRPGAVDLSGAVQRALEDLGDPEGLTVDVPVDLVVWADPSQLPQVVANLVTNAFRHAGPPVRVEARPARDVVSLAVEDSGPGVPRQFRPQLFERLSRADQQRDGAGLGLYLARLMCRAVGGDLHHEPRSDGPGSRFVVTLAIAPVSVRGQTQTAR